MAQTRFGPFVLIIRDGWGVNPNPSHAPFDAPLIARQRGLTPTAEMLDREWPRTLIKTSGEDVGLPDGTMGNSEVGHQNIGAGRVVDQESVAITKACRAGLEKNAIIAGALSRARASEATGRVTVRQGIRNAAGGENSRRVHLLGIASDAGVHGQLEHLYACLRACKALGVPGDRVFVHLFTDGRDTGPFTALEFIRQVEAQIRAIGVGRIASVIGRYFAMDRDYRWERVGQAFAALTGRASASPGFTPRTAASAEEAVRHCYENPLGETQKGDEFVLPTIIGATPEAQCDSRVADGDTVIFYNYRGDRPREISAAFVFPDEAWAKVKPSPDSGRRGFDRGTKLELHYVIMTEYWEELLPHCRVAFPKPPKLKNIAGEYFSLLGLRQFRCAETEKYPHVTFFFNDYRDEPFPGERRENPQSPKVPTYDLEPEMSAGQVCEAVLKSLGAADGEDVLVVNFANPDMVGHTGNLEAAVLACAAVDRCVGRIVEATLGRGGSLIVTADHGNCEQMLDPGTGSPHTAHTVYDVPLYVIGEAFRGRMLKGDFEAAGWFDPGVRAQRGRLADIVPTAIDMMGLSRPAEMSGESLLR